MRHSRICHAKTGIVFENDMLIHNALNAQPARCTIAISHHSNRPIYIIHFGHIIHDQRMIRRTILYSQYICNPPRIDTSTC